MTNNIPNNSPIRSFDTLAQDNSPIGMIKTLSNTNAMSVSCAQTDENSLAQLDEQTTQTANAPKTTNNVSNSYDFEFLKRFETDTNQTAGLNDEVEAAQTSTEINGAQETQTNNNTENNEYDFLSRFGDAEEVATQQIPTEAQNNIIDGYMNDILGDEEYKIKSNVIYKDENGTPTKQEVDALNESGQKVTFTIEYDSKGRITSLWKVLYKNGGAVDGKKVTVTYDENEGTIKFNRSDEYPSDYEGCDYTINIATGDDTSIYDAEGNRVSTGSPIEKLVEKTLASRGETLS